jgi:alpha-tubulin suppressor-like RCC1 family protein
MKAIAAGSAHCLALKADGTVWAWGWNSKGQLGDGSTSDRSTAAVVKGGKKLGAFVKAIAAGGTMKQTDGGHSLALVAQGEVFGWGWNVKGQLGIDTKSNDQLVPDSAVQTLTEPDPKLGGRAVAQSCGDCRWRPAQSGNRSTLPTEVDLKLTRGRVRHSRATVSGTTGLTGSAPPPVRRPGPL